MPIRLRPFLLLTFVFAACGTTVHYTALNPPPHPMGPRPPETVEVFSTARPERPFVDVGLLEAQQSSGMSLDAPPEVLIKLRQEAGRAGCDGLILQGANDSVVGGGSQGNSSTTTLRGYRATCIAYR